MAPRKFSLSHLIAVIRTGNGELVEDVVHHRAVDQDEQSPHGTVVDAGPIPRPKAGRIRPSLDRAPCPVPDRMNRRSPVAGRRSPVLGRGQEGVDSGSSSNANAMALAVMPT